MAIKIVITAENGEDARQQMLNLLGSGKGATYNIGINEINGVKDRGAVAEVVTDILKAANTEADVVEEKKTRRKPREIPAEEVAKVFPEETPAAPAEEIAPAPTHATKEISNEDLRTVLVAIKDTKGEGIKALLGKFGVKKATDLDQTQRAEFLNQVNALP
jgi:hypothetical protein